MLNLTENFNMRLKPDERVMLSTLARHFERTQSDTVRLLIRAAHKNLPGHAPNSDPTGAGNNGRVTAGAPLPEILSAEVPTP